MLKETLQAILQAAQHATSTDATRVHLQNVLLIRKGATQIRIVATDAHMLSDVTLEDAELADIIKDTRYTITPQDATLLKLVAKEWGKSYPSVPSARVGEDLVVGVLSSIQARIRPETQDVKFPDVDRIIGSGKYSEESVQIALDAELLLHLAKALQNGNKKHHVTLTIQGKTNPIRVSLNGTAGARSGVIMPVRL